MRILPDISHDVKADLAYPIDRVGMGNIEMPVLLSYQSRHMTLPAKVDAEVNLRDTTAKGIHMSRLYMALKQTLEKGELGVEKIRALLGEFIRGQEGLSQSAFLKIRFELPVERKALLSEGHGWRQYPVVLLARQTEGGVQFSVEFEVLYSSTCPCSAALARQLVQEQFSKDFSERHQVTVEEVAQWLTKESSIVATPHAQRSVAKVGLRFSDQVKSLDEVFSWIDQVEEALQTAVQAVVKRMDEQEFARRNGSNLMFCEDAARRLKVLLESGKNVVDYWARVEHIESLHPHDAVAFVTKGIPGGYQP